MKAIFIVRPHRISNKFKHIICDTILKGHCGYNGKDYYLHFEVMDYSRGLFAGFIVVRRLGRRMKRFRLYVVRWPDSGKPFSWRDEFYRLPPGEKFKG
jgi:hypothetical protein